MTKTSKEGAWTTSKDGSIKLEPTNVRRKYPLAQSDSFTFALFQDVLDDAYERGIEGEDIAGAVKWFFNRIQKFKYGNAEDIIKARDRLKGRIEYGKMYFFFYQAKHDKRLPYWDKFPLIFPIDPKPGGFLGINLHYIPPKLRLELMSKLYNLAADGRYDKNTKLVISYEILKSVVGMKAFKPCVKYYLRSQVRSPFVQIYYSEWAMAAALPVQQFTKATDTKVWRDSRAKIGS